jgi:hypothetical protein
VGVEEVSFMSLLFRAREARKNKINPRKKELNIKYSVKRRVVE